MPEVLVPVPVSQLTADQAAQLAYLEILTLRAEMSAQMASLEESVTRVFTDFDNELQQIRDGLTSVLNAKDAQIADLQAQVQAQVDNIDAARERLDAKAAELEANDPAPEPDPEPAGDEPV